MTTDDNTENDTKTDECAESALQSTGNPATDIESVTRDADNESRARAIQSLLIEEGLLSTDAVDEIIATYEDEIGPMNGARIVARAWTDSAYRERLLDDATAAAAELGIDVELHNVVLEAVENTDHLHNVMVCTLCSCYPWAVLGLPPTWYKSEAYRARAVREPRTLLREDFDVELAQNVDVRVWDSTSELRYFVLPQRPPDTEDYSEAELVELVSRDAMIGVDRLDNIAATDGGSRLAERTLDSPNVLVDEQPSFHAPWQARAFALAVALADEYYPWDRFQSRLATAIDTGIGTSTDSEARYYEQWLTALEELLFAEDYLSLNALRARTIEFATGERTAEEWVEGDHGHIEASSTDRHPHGSAFHHHAGEGDEHD